MTALQRVKAAIESLRAPVAMAEYDLHLEVARVLAEHGFVYTHEARILPRCRLDFLTEGVGIEIKRGRPNRTSLLRQLERYAASPLVECLLVVCEHGFPLPEAIQGKPCLCISLRRLWGISVPSAKTSHAGTAPSPPPVLPANEAQEALPAADERRSLPRYLEPADTRGRLYGTLSYNRRRKAWTIKGEPVVTEMAKRLFPGSNSGRRGLAHFSAHRRIVGDLNWLLQRYPLAVAPADLDRWERALADAQEYALKRELSLQADPGIRPDEASFSGKLREFQQAGFSWLCRTERALLADEMGLGKTVETLAALSWLKAFPCLVVVPPHLIRNWQSEIQRFLRLEGRSPRVHVIRGLRPYALPQADIYLIHYLLLRGWKFSLPTLSFRALVFDEIQELRRGGTEKYSAASLLANASDRVIGLSGTPIYNLGGEIWHVTNILDYHFLGDFDSFSREWCTGYGNAVVLRPELLGDHLRREGLMLRRTKKDVLPELPDKRRLVQEIDADSTLYTRLMQPVLLKMKAWRDSESLSASQRALLEGEISQEERQATGIAKAPYVSQFVRALVESGEKVLLFAHHHAVMDVYRKELRTLSPAFITGRETPAKKSDSADRFMNGRTNLCVISLRAASGLNLQRGSCVVFGELDWSPAVHSQAEDRAHRIGQRDSLLCYYLVCPQGSDSVIQEALGLKVSQFLGLMGEAPVSAVEQAASAALARRHVEMLVNTWMPDAAG